MLKVQRVTGSVLFCLCSCLATGCADPRHVAEIGRLQEQLQEAGRRLAVATEQLDAANVQAQVFQETIALVEQQAEAAKHKSDLQLAAEAAKLDRARQDAAMASVRVKELESRVAELLREKEAARKQALLSPVGVWAFPVHMPHLGFGGWLRLTVHDDSEVFIECWEPRHKTAIEEFASVRDGGWSRTTFDEPYKRDLVTTTVTADCISAHALDSGEWVIGEKDSKGLLANTWCTFAIDGEGAARIKPFDADFGRDGKDRFNKPIWIPTERVDEAWEPPAVAAEPK